MSRALGPHHQDSATPTKSLALCTRHSHLQLLPPAHHCHCRATIQPNYRSPFTSTSTFTPTSTSTSTGPAQHSTPPAIAMSATNGHRSEVERIANHTEEKHLPGGWVVLKFGGTSVGKFAENIADIVK